MAAARWSARHQPMHEGTQAGEVVGLMLDADDQPVGVPLGRLEAPFIAQLAAAIAIDRLTGFERFNDLVDTFRGAFPYLKWTVRERYWLTQSRSGCSRSASGSGVRPWRWAV